MIATRNKRKRTGRLWRFAGLCAIALFLVALVSADAQRRGRGRGRGRSFDDPNVDPEITREQEEMEKAIDPAFSSDVFTFARLRFNNYERGWGFGNGRTWGDDAPQADWLLTYRLFQVSSLKIDPGVHFIDITPKDIAKYPFTYIAGAGRLVLTDEEAESLRKHLLNGGFLMVDDFWGDTQWEHFYEQIKRVFPDREPVELTLDHPIFHSVFDFKQEPQTPSVFTYIQYGGRSYDPADYGAKSHEPHFYAIFDDKQRIMALICHNNHFGDGWEHETEDEGYFDKYSEPMAYSMFVNILVYTMAH